jgi:hypothetical protein
MDGNAIGDAPAPMHQRANLPQNTFEGKRDPLGTEGRIEEIASELTEDPYEPGPARFEFSFSKNEQRFLIDQTVAVKLLGCRS